MTQKEWCEKYCGNKHCLIYNKRKQKEIAMTTEEVMKDYLDGKPVEVVELGGLGEEFEKGIWTGVFKMLDEHKDLDINDWLTGEGADKTWKNNENGDLVADAELMKVVKGDGLCGAQAGMILKAFFMIKSYGWEETLKSAPQERLLTLTLN